MYILVLNKGIENSIKVRNNINCQKEWDLSPKKKECGYRRNKTSCQY